MIRRRVGTLVGLCLLVGPSAISQGQHVSTSRELAMDLARFGVPAGLVVPEEDLSGPRRTLRKATTAERAAFKSQLQSKLRNFNESTRSCKARLDRDVVHIRSLTVPDDVVNMLERDASISEAGDVRAWEAIWHHVISAITGFPNPGVVGTGGPEPECLSGHRVHVPGGKTTPVALLDEIARQMPGVVWFVTYDPERAGLNPKVGLMCPNGAWRRITVGPGGGGLR
jgi:hypothetical protein